MDNANFEVDDITKFRIMQMKCARCRNSPVQVSALIYHGKMYVDEQADIRKDVVAVFCQGDAHCDGEAWAFPVDDDNSILRKHNALTSLCTNN